MTWALLGLRGEVRAEALPAGGLTAGLARVLLRAKARGCTSSSATACSFSLGCAFCTRDILGSCTATLTDVERQNVEAKGGGRSEFIGFGS